MVGDSLTCPPADCAGWIARQQGTAPGEECRAGVVGELDRLTRQILTRLHGGESNDDVSHFDRYLARIWQCVEYHWRRWGAAGPLTFDAVLARLERGDLGFSGRADVVFEVVLAQALELGDSRAAEMFDRDFMPKVRAVARHLGGQRAVDAVENFTAELILPRGERPPKIAGFQGRTTLAAWLRAVVANYWISQTRKRQNVNLAVLPEKATQDGDVAAAIDGRPCEELLRPVFSDALRPLETEDRILVKMLLLDGVGQGELARALGVHSGTLTRRRQRATVAVLMHVRELVERHAAPRQVAHCLELVLAGGDTALRARLTDVLAAAVRDGIGGDTDGLGGPPQEDIDGLGSPPHENSAARTDREVDERV